MNMNTAVLECPNDYMLRLKQQLNQLMFEANAVMIFIDHTHRDLNRATFQLSPSECLVMNAVVRFGCAFEIGRVLKAIDELVAKHPFLMYYLKAPSSMYTNCKRQLEAIVRDAQSFHKNPFLHQEPVLVKLVEQWNREKVTHFLVQSTILPVVHRHSFEKLCACEASHNVFQLSLQVLHCFVQGG